jgi:SRSO17 transposase
MAPSRHGHAFIDRALYVPKGGTDDPARLKATYVPGDIGFSTKPQLAAEMIDRALAAGVPFRWVAADSVYGVGDIERDLRQAGKGYVLGVHLSNGGEPWEGNVIPGPPGRTGISAGFAPRTDSASSPFEKCWCRGCIFQRARIRADAF